MKLFSVLAVFIALALPMNAFAREDNFNAGAAAAANPTGVSNANCNSALVQFCEQVYAESYVPSGGSTDSQTNGKTWDTGKAAFPGSDTARDVTASWQSGKTNAIFSAPMPKIGESGVVIFTLLIALTFMHKRRRGRFPI